MKILKKIGEVAIVLLLGSPKKMWVWGDREGLLYGRAPVLLIQTPGHHDYVLSKGLQAVMDPSTAPDTLCLLENNEQILFS